MLPRFTRTLARLELSLWSLSNLLSGHVNIMPRGGLPGHGRTQFKVSSYFTKVELVRFKYFNAPTLNVCYCCQLDDATKSHLCYCAMTWRQSGEEMAAQMSPSWSSFSLSYPDLTFDVTSPCASDWSIRLT